MFYLPERCKFPVLTYSYSVVMAQFDFDLGHVVLPGSLFCVLPAVAT